MCVHLLGVKPANRTLSSDAARRVGDVYWNVNIDNLSSLEKLERTT